MEVSGQSSPPAALPAGKRPSTTANESGWVTQPVRMWWLKEKCPCPEQNPSCPAHSLITILADLAERLVMNAMEYVVYMCTLEYTKSALCRRRIFGCEQLIS
jgi:hypothetical protein